MREAIRSAAKFGNKDPKDVVSLSLYKHTFLCMRCGEPLEAESRSNT